MRILLVRLSAFGDVVLCLPLAQALKTAFPEATLAWVVERSLAPLLIGAPSVDVVFTTQTKRWRRAPLDSLSAVRLLLREARHFAPDVIVDAQGLFKSAWVTALVPARRKVGFGWRTATERVNLLATTEWVDPADRPHVSARMLALAEHLSGRRGFQETPDVGHLSARPDTAVDAFVAAQASAPLAVLQPFASAARKEWGDTRFVSLSRQLAATGLVPVVLWGPGEEGRAREIAQASGALLAPPTGPGAVARLVSRAALFVGGDTGPTHLAAAAGTPTVALFVWSDPQRYAPRGRYVEVLGGPRGYNRPHSGSGSPGPEVDDVLRAADRLGALAPSPRPCDGERGGAADAR